MIENGKIVVDTAKINALMEDLSLKKGEAKSAFKKGLRQSAQIIQRQARMNLRSVVNQASGTTLNSKNLVQFIRIMVYRNAQGARVDIMDDKRKSTNLRLEKKGLENKSFILKFFALGTQDRYTKSHSKSGYGRNTKRKGRGGYRGRIGTSQFFRRAVDSKKTEAESMLEKSIIEQINKVVKRRK